MSRNVSQSQQELEAHLQEQLQFLETSAKIYDEGNQSEAKRMAHIIRILVHDTNVSTSLLKQLGRKGISFYDTAAPPNPRNLLTHSGFLSISPATGFEPVFDAPLPVAPLKSSFNSWWNAVVLIDDKRHEWTRKELVLTVTHKDGGSHIDPELDELYFKLTRENSMGWIASDAAGEKPMDGPHLPALRQITHEILRTLKPDLPKRRPSNNISFLMPMFVERKPGEGPPAGVTMLPTRRIIPSRRKGEEKIGRNDPCPCGSDKKYKKCHGS